jgi:hypothetical protein
VGPVGPVGPCKDSVLSQLLTPEVVDVKTFPEEAGTPKSGSASAKLRNSYLSTGTSKGDVFFTFPDLISAI